MSMTPPIVSTDDKNAELRRMAELYTKKVNADELARADQVVDGFLAELDEPLPQVPEHVFREIFLPYFLGIKKPTREEDAYAHWLGLVGNATTAVEIIDPQRNVLFKVPPLINSDAINTTRQNAQSYSSIMATYIDDAKVFASRARLEYQKGISEYMGELLSNGGVNIDPWREMLAYYAKAFGDGTIPAGKAALKVSKVDDDFDFE